MIASDVRVIKGISNRVRLMQYKARYDRNSAARVRVGVCAAACGPDQDARRTDQATDGSDLTRFEMPLITLTSLAIILEPGSCYTSASAHTKPATPSHLSKIAPKHSKNGCLQPQSMHCRSRPVQPLSATTRVSRDPGVRAQSQPRHIPTSTPRFRSLRPQHLDWRTVDGSQQAR